MNHFWYEAAGNALRDEIQVWRQNMKHACKEINDRSRYQAPEAPWVRQFAWLNLALSGVTLVSRFAAPAYAAMLATNLAADLMQRRFKDDARVFGSFLENNYKGVLDYYFQVIDDVERQFFHDPRTAPLAAAIQQVIAELMESEMAGWIRKDSLAPNSSNIDSERASGRLRDIINLSGVLPNETGYLRDTIIEGGFAAVYDNIMEIVRRSNLVPVRFREAGAVLVQYGGSAVPGLSGKTEEICVKKDYHYFVNKVIGCDLNFKAVRAEGKSDFLVILNDVWQFDVAIEDGYDRIPVGVGSVPIRVKHIIVRRRRQAPTFPVSGYAMTYEIRAALEKGFAKYCLKQSAVA